VPFNRAPQTFGLCNYPNCLPGPATRDNKDPLYELQGTSDCFITGRQLPVKGTKHIEQKHTPTFKYPWQEIEKFDSMFGKNGIQSGRAYCAGEMKMFLITTQRSVISIQSL